MITDGSLLLGITILQQSQIGRAVQLPTAVQPSRVPHSLAAVPRVNAKGLAYGERFPD